MSWSRSSARKRSQALSKLEGQLARSLATVPHAIDRSELAREAHSLVSQAGMLGFLELADSCRDLEAACLSGEEVAASSNRRNRLGTGGVRPLTRRFGRSAGSGTDPGRAPPDGETHLSRRSGGAGSGTSRQSAARVVHLSRRFGRGQARPGRAPPDGEIRFSWRFRAKDRSLTGFASACPGGLLAQHGAQEGEAFAIRFQRLRVEHWHPDLPFLRYHGLGEGAGTNNLRAPDRTTDRDRPSSIACANLTPFGVPGAWRGWGSGQSRRLPGCVRAKVDGPDDLTRARRAAEGAV